MQGYLEVDAGERGRILLTPRERDVLVALCRPLAADVPIRLPASVRAIAAELVVTEAAVKQHLLHLYDKFGIHDETENRRVRLAGEALRCGAVAGADQGRIAHAAIAERALQVGRQAVARRAWAEAFEAFSAARLEGVLGTVDLESLAEAARWSGRVEEAIEIRERAHEAALTSEEHEIAARTALGLVIDQLAAGRPNLAASWLRMAGRIVEPIPECLEHGRVAMTLALVQLATGDLAGALSNARQARTIARRFGDRDIGAEGIALEGYALIRSGRSEEGLTLLDEAMTAATGGGLGPLATGIVYCRSLSACLDLQDYPRAIEYSDAIVRRGDEVAAVGFPGDCRTHQVAVHIVRGAWEQGVLEVEIACQETTMFDLNHTALAFAELGELRLRQGDLDAAEAAYRRAHELGADAQPGLALLAFARGDIDAAAAQLRHVARDADGDPLRLARSLPALVRVELADGRLAAARQAAERLAVVADTYRTAALRAAAAAASGSVRLAEGDAEGSSVDLRTATRLWHEAGAPWDAAVARLDLARALAARGDRVVGRMEAEAARSAFDRLGARLESATADRLINALA